MSAAMQPLFVSIIIDNFNYARFLRAAIDSALAQTYAHKEVIVVDDGSTDISRDIIGQYGDRIRSVLKANGGQASALNAGFGASRGDIIVFLDSDDILLSDCVGNAARVFDETRGERAVAKVQWPLWVIDEFGNRRGDETRPPRVPPQGDFREAVLERGPAAVVGSPTSGNAWSRAFLQWAMPAPEDVAYYRVCADEFLNTLAPIFGEVRTIADPQGLYRIHGANIYSARRPEDALHLDLDGHEQQCQALSKYLAKRGISVDLDSWRRNSWFHRLQQTVDDVSSLIGEGQSFVLIDDDTFGPREIFRGRRAIHLHEQHGVDWGPPQDDNAAIDQLDRRREAGASFLVIAWPSFWWLEHYREFRRHLELHFKQILSNDRLIAFNLRSPVPRARPLVSIIINNYNYGRFLREAIDSALAQDYSAVEVVVVDDGSTDDSHEIISSYGNRIRAVFKPNGGQGSAYNAGLAVCRGQYVCMLDADDTLYPHAIRTAVDALDDPKIVKVQWPLAMTDAAGRPTGELSTKRTPPDGDLLDFVTENGPYYDWYTTTGPLYSRQFLDRVLPVPEPPYRNGGDVYLITLAPVFGTIRNVSQPLGTYRAHGQNNYRERKLDAARIQNYIVRFETNCDMLAKYLREIGRTPERELWKQRNFNYLWPSRLLRAKHDLTELAPSGSSVILVNDDEWGDGQLLPQRRLIAFLEREGEYWGPPPDDQTAISELQRLRSAGASFVAFWWTCYWWLQEYPRMNQWIRSKFPCVMEADHLTVFDLRART
jgi:glycosyltransferase involved in cell wall biosynthesis